MPNFFEEQEIENKKIPLKWRSNNALNDLETFLQENWDQRKDFYNDRNSESKQKFLSFLSHGNIRTNNYIGSINFNGETINIFPKVFREGKYLNNDTSQLSLNQMIKNILIWIEYCNKIQYAFVNFPSKFEDVTNFKELFISIYIKLVEEMIINNAYYKYENKEDDINFIKGRFNLNDYLINKIAKGKPHLFCCEFSEFQYDNALNRIIKYVCKIIFNSTCFQNQLKLRKILMQLNDVTDIVCVPNDCDKIVLSKSQFKFKPILSLSKMFLLNQLSSFNLDNNMNFCFLFPSEILFEGFVGGFLQEMLKKDAEVKLQKSSDYLFENLFIFGEKKEKLGTFKMMKYDIFVEFKKTKKLFILDTKYKMLPEFVMESRLEGGLADQLDSNDFYQVLEYANKNDLRDVYLLFPQLKKENTKNTHLIGESYGQNGSTNVHIIKIPFVCEENENDFKRKLTKELEKIFVNS